MTFLGRDAIDIDALHTDRYLEMLLAQRDAGATPAAAAPGVDPAIAVAAGRLGRDLVRVHPSFRFEERLARRLADIAAAMGMPVAAGAEGAAIPITPFPIDAAIDQAIDPAADDEGDWPVVPRPVLIGGAVASAAISLAGAAYVAWRLGRPGGDPMARAVRAANQLRGAGRPIRPRLD